MKTFSLVIGGIIFLFLGGLFFSKIYDINQKSMQVHEEHLSIEFNKLSGIEIKIQELESLLPQIERLSLFFTHVPDINNVSIPELALSEFGAFFFLYNKLFPEQNISTKNSQIFGQNRDFYLKNVISEIQILKNQKRNGEEKISLYQSKKEEQSVFNRLKLRIRNIFVYFRN